MLENIRKAGEEEDKKRALEWEEREKKIKNKMNMMADTVIKKKDEAERDLESKIRKYEEEKERKDKIDDEFRKYKSNKKQE